MMKVIEKKYGSIKDKDQHMVELYIKYRQAKLEKRDKYLTFGEYSNYYTNDLNCKDVTTYEYIILKAEPSKMIADGV
jgi:hypothetical protein